MSLFDLFRRRKPVPVPPRAEERAPMKVSHSALLAARQQPEQSPKPLEAYHPAPGVVPADQLAEVLAMDSTPYAYLNQSGMGGSGSFAGYPYLAELSQRPEYRKMVSTIAEEMVRKWVELKSTGDDDKTDKIAVLIEAMDKHKLRDRFRAAMEQDGFFGRGQIYIEVKTPSGTVAGDDPAELETPLFLDPAKIKPGSLVAFRNVEPFWTYPGVYNSSEPLKADFYKPSQWFVMGKTVHASRLMMFVSREVPDMLKPAYSFGGLSLTQVAEPYVNNWLRTRNSVGDLVHSFSLSILKTNMAATLSGSVDTSLFARADLFNQTRDNRGLMMVDKDMEEVEQINTPLSGLHELQAQAQEHMASISNIPLVKLTGITPSGLNASSDGEIRVFYDFIASQQQAVFRDNLDRALKILQLDAFGEIDDEITFEFVPLHQLNETELAALRKSDADTDAVYVQNGIVDAEEVRKRLAGDPDGPYHGLDLSDEPEAEEDPEDPAPDDS